jgi:hypothetical protein
MAPTYPYTEMLEAQKMPLSPNDPGYVPFPTSPGSPAFLGMMGPWFENFYRGEAWKRNQSLIEQYKIEFGNFLINYEAGRISNHPPVPPAGWEIQATRLDPQWGDWGHSEFAYQQTAPQVMEMPSYPLVPSPGVPPTIVTGPPAANNAQIGDKINAQAPAIDGWPIGYEQTDPGTGYRWQKGVGQTPFGPSYFWIRIA